MKKSILLLVAFVLFLNSCYSQELRTVKLNQPQLNIGKPFMQVLKERKSTREFSDKELSLQDLSNLLWAANGINREDGHKTAPSAMNTQDIDLYVILPHGIFFYNASENKLQPIVSGDHRKDAGTQPFVATAPVNIIMVSDQSKMKSAKDENTKNQWSYMNVGFVSENIYLYCASEGLVTVTRASIDFDKLSGILKLRKDQKIILGQTVGFPK